MEKPKENKHPDIELPLTYIEMEDMLNGKQYTWQLEKRSNGESIIIHAYLDNRGIFKEKEENK